MASLMLQARRVICYLSVVASEFFASNFLSIYPQLSRFVGRTFSESVVREDEEYVDVFHGVRDATFPVVPIRIPNRDFVFRYATNFMKSRATVQAQKAFTLQMTIFSAARHFPAVRTLYASLAIEKP
eukprot:GHVP01001069.1.p1 GENE.GHVP01001069.1~~GHVP01001069.1.p1  ORF type:complete len:127 (+),score=12.48 GHVP01001069.1:176-556(+)